MVSVDLNQDSAAHLLMKQHLYSSDSETFDGAWDTPSDFSIKPCD